MATATLEAPKTTAPATDKTADRPQYVEPDGFVRYEEKDLAYSDRKVLEAVKMDNPAAQREYLQDVIEMYADKYGVQMTAEWLLEEADIDSVYVQKMLVEGRENTAERARRGEKTSYTWEEIQERLREEFGDDLFD